MKSSINVYSNNKINFFLTQLFEDYNFKLKTFDQINYFQKTNKTFKKSSYVNIQYYMCI